MHGTHPKHVAHVSDAGRVETQRLVECTRPLRRVEAKESHEKEGAACWLRKKVLGAVGHRRGTHPKHIAHVSDAGRVESQRLVECPRLLRRVEANESHEKEGAHVG